MAEFGRILLTGAAGSLGSHLPLAMALALRQGLFSPCHLSGSWVTVGASLVFYSDDGGVASLAPCHA